jgi:hypothetical protein
MPSPRRARLLVVEAMEPRTLMTAAPSILLNEIEANEPGTADNRYQYVELIGTPGASLTNIYFVTFDGAAGNTGNADLVVNLSSYSLGSDGLLVIQSSATTGHSIPAATTLVPDPTFFTKTGGFLNGSLSFFLYDSPNAPFVAGTDYDTNNDGILDHLPAGAVALDNVAIPDTNNSKDIVYGNVEVTELASQNLGTADAVTRFPGTTATANSSWFGGELVDTNNVDSQIDYDPTRKSANQPANTILTPGAANFAPPPLNLVGPAFYLKLDADEQHVDIWTNTTGAGAFNQQALLTNISTINILGNSGTDSAVVDFSAGNPLPYAGLNDTGAGNGAGDELLVIGSTSSDVVTASTGQMVVDGHVLNATNVAQLTFTPGPAADSLSVQSSSLTLAPPTQVTAMTFTTITLSAASRLSVQSPPSPPLRAVLVTSNLTLAPSAQFDLAANDLIIHAADLSAITSDIRSGILSSTASTNLTTIAAIQNSTDAAPTGPTLYPNFDNVTAQNTDILVKFTYFGDANLDGKINSSDYIQIDNGFAQNLPGWFNGDFNNDGVVNGDDYTLIDNAFNTQASATVASAVQIIASKPARQTTPLIATNLLQIQAPPEIASSAPNIEELLLHKDLLDQLS